MRDDISQIEMHCSLTQGRLARIQRTRSTEMSLNFAEQLTNRSIIRRYYNNEPCALTVAGIKLYLMTLPQQISKVYRDTATLSFDPFIRDLHKSFDMSSIGVNKMWEIAMAHEKHLDPAGRKNLLQQSSASCPPDRKRWLFRFINGADKSW